MNGGVRIGALLIRDGAIDAATLEQHAAKQRGPLGQFLLKHGLISGPALARAAAAQYALTVVDLTTTTPQPGLLQARDMADYHARRYLPLARSAEAMVVACEFPTPDLQAELSQRYGLPVQLAVASTRDLTQALQQHAAARIGSRAAVHGLRRHARMLSAWRTLLPHQQRGLGLLLVAILGFIGWGGNASWHTLLIACNLFYFMALAFKLQLYAQGTTALATLRQREQALLPAITSMAEDAWPIYSVLVPLYRESEPVLRRLLAQLSALDYPAEKLDIKLITEADDVTTRNLLRALRPPATMEILAVPACEPRTKPKACNFALPFVRGAYVVIYDAEDAPAPDQLKRAVVLFSQMNPNTACLQAPLNYYNRTENLLTRLFALEYSILFRQLLPALERMGLPMPLGGTSNHLRTAALRAVGGWDPFNVTEDADLGIRLHYFGYRTAMLPSITLEESPITLGAWMRQRTRWIKGYIQTWAVYMRDARMLKARLGRPAYYGFQFFVGAPALTFLLAPILWGLFMLSPLGLFPTGLSDTMLSICMIAFFGGVASHLLYARAAIAQERWEGMGTALLVFPFYWLLHSAACARALWQLVRAPHYWEKTTHGVSVLFNDKTMG